MENYTEELEQIKKEVLEWDANHGIDIEAFLEDDLTEEQIPTPFGIYENIDFTEDNDGE